MLQPMMLYSTMQAYAPLPVEPQIRTPILHTQGEVQHVVPTLKEGLLTIHNDIHKYDDSSDDEEDEQEGVDMPISVPYHVHISP